MAIDAVRGIVMVVMVLDHARDFYFGFRPRPTDLEHTTVVLFLTRWVTHFCAPGFVLLAGTAAYLYGKKNGLYGQKNGPVGLRRFLFTRGLWLVVLEVTVVKLGWIPEPLWIFTVLQVIWVIGLSMILLSLLVSLPARAIGALGIALIALHGLLDPIEATSLGNWRFLWSVLHEPGGFEPLPGHTVWLAYPLVPWVGVMMAGFALGEVMTGPREARRRILTGLGLSAIALFVIVRGLNVYGDPEPWAAQASPVFTVFSFLNCEKYPPSLAYLLMTLGPLLVLLAALDREALPRALAPLVTFGRVPLFFYVAHLYLLRPIGIAIAYGRFGASTFERPPDGHALCPELPLYATYVAWITAVLLLYPACRGWERLKRRHRGAWWVGYV